MRLLELLRSPEGKTLEFKRDLSSPEGVLRSIVAFANTAGGSVLIGVEDGSRKVGGVDRPLDVEERLANLISDHIVPRLLPEIEIVPWRDKNVLVVRVYPSSAKPHYLMREGESRGVYVRLGSSNRKADADLIEELKRHARNVGHDEQPMPELDSEALDFRAASGQFAEIRKLKRSDLGVLRLTTSYQDRTVPTIGGMLLFGKERERYFPDAWIQAARFGGQDKRDILDRAEIRSFPALSVEDALLFIRKHLQLGARIRGAKRTDEWSLPPIALREAVVNAVVHTDYSQRGAPIRISIFDDRVEVENPGMLPFGMTTDDMREGISRLRNRVLGRVFNELGLIEQWGSGIQRMLAACLDAGHPAPAFEEVGTRFRVTLYSARGAGSTLNDTDQRIVDLLASHEGYMTSEIAQSISLTPRATRTRLVKLVERGIVQAVGTGPQDPKRRYYLTRR